MADKKTPPQKLKLVPTVADIESEVPPAKETSLDRVYRENGITYEVVRRQPRMTKLLGHMGGLDVAAEYLRSAEDADAKKFIEIYDRSYKDRDYLEFEGICAAAGVNGKKMFGMIVAEAAVESEYSVAMITAIKMPDIVAKTAELAMDPLGHRERSLIAKASGWLPRPKGSQTNIQINTANGMAPQQPTVLPSIDQDVRDLGEEFQVMMSENSPKMIDAKV